MITCKLDSGSATGNVPLCSHPAEFIVTYHNGSSGPFRLPVCARHVSATEGAAYPGHDSTEPIMTCEWFALCGNVPTQMVPHPILGAVPTCDRCATRAS